MKIARTTRINHEIIITIKSPVLGIGGLFDDIWDKGTPLAGSVVAGAFVGVADTGKFGKTIVTVGNGSSVSVELVNWIGVISV
jgi:hypothetical protein